MGNRLDYTKKTESKLVGRVLQIQKSDQSRNKGSSGEYQHEEEGIWRMACNKINKNRDKSNEEKKRLDVFQQKMKAKGKEEMRFH